MWWLGVAPGIAPAWGTSLGLVLQEKDGEQGTGEGME